jgi:hypothetical protein
MEELVLTLVKNSGARRKSSKVQEHLDELKRFWKHEVVTLARIRKATGFREWPVPQYQRDLVFLSYRGMRDPSNRSPLTLRRTSRWSLVHDSARENHRFSALVLGIVKSAPFQMNTKK